MNMMESPRESAKDKGVYAGEYMAEINAQNTIIKEADHLLSVIRYSSSLKPEAVAKVIKIQEKRKADALAEIAKITGKNQEEITQHMQ